MFQPLRGYQAVCTSSASVLSIKKVIYKLLNLDVSCII
jgi:hypothetical protein